MAISTHHALSEATCRPVTQRFKSSLGQEFPGRSSASCELGRRGLRNADMCLAAGVAGRLQGAVLVA